ncbi:hypothetical protein BDM02DRAFT_3116536 [Thelephora ganbajun]|uniref:Uncharacterized protein n=1 Tax=Thelephora ganbajun TaxID=370292 RepID=A0ACB6ZDX1_THEGA|nr:hypothetical protein BDM02DRAFT_3116536 [Thelephora ganbajun]
MTVPNYTLPPPIYLPSSGGYTISRFIEDVSALRLSGTFDLVLTGLLPSRSTSAFFHSENTA